MERVRRAGVGGRERLLVELAALEGDDDAFGIELRLVEIEREGGDGRREDDIVLERKCGVRWAGVVLNGVKTRARRKTGRVYGRRR